MRSRYGLSCQSLRVGDSQEPVLDDRRSPLLISSTTLFQPHLIMVYMYLTAWVIDLSENRRSSTKHCAVVSTYLQCFKSLISILPLLRNLCLRPPLLLAASTSKPEIKHSQKHISTYRKTLQQSVSLQSTN